MSAVDQGQLLAKSSSWSRSSRVKDNCLPQSSTGQRQLLPRSEADQGHLVVNDSNLLVKVTCWSMTVTCWLKSAAGPGELLIMDSAQPKVNCWPMLIVFKGQQLAKVSSWSRPAVGQGQELAKVRNWPRSLVGQGQQLAIDQQLAKVSSWLQIS